MKSLCESSSSSFGIFLPFFFLLSVCGRSPPTAGLALESICEGSNEDSSDIELRPSVLNLGRQPQNLQVKLLPTEPQGNPFKLSGSRILPKRAVTLRLSGTQRLPHLIFLINSFARAKRGFRAASVISALPRSAFHPRAETEKQREESCEVFTVASRSPVRTGVRRGKHPPLTLLDFTQTCAGNLRSPVLGSTQGSPSLFRATNHLGVGSGSPFPGPTDRRGPASAPQAGTQHSSSPRQPCEGGVWFVDEKHSQENRCPRLFGSARLRR